MANRMIVQKLTRLTLVRKGKGTAKHPNMRDSVVEAVKAVEERKPDAPHLMRRGSWG